MKADIKLCPSSLIMVTLVFFPSWSRSSSFPLWRRCYQPRQIVSLVKQHFMCVVSCIGKQKSSWCYWPWAWFTEGQCMVRPDEMQTYGSFLFQTIYGKWWHFAGPDGEHCFALRHVLVVNYLRRVSALLDREFLGHFMGREGPIFSIFDSYAFSCGSL
jgi:hypothetical protein